MCFQKKIFSCLLYSCSKCYCFQRVAPWTTLNQTHSTGISDNTNSDLYALAIPRAKLKTVAFDSHSMGSDGSDFTIREDAERRVITEITRTEFHGGDNGTGHGGVYDAYHAIEEYDLDAIDGQPRRQITHHREYVNYPPPLRQLEPDYGQDDRSIESYHTNEHRMYGPNRMIEFRSESRHL